MTTPDGGPTKKHLIFSLNVDTGDINAGWPVDVEATAVFNGTTSIRRCKGNAGARHPGQHSLCGYGSLRDCNVYHGWLVGVPIDNPVSVTAWATGDRRCWGGAIWGVGGVASDGTESVRYYR